MKKKDNLNKCNGFENYAQEWRKAQNFDWGVGK